MWTVQPFFTVTGPRWLSPAAVTVPPPGSTTSAPDGTPTIAPGALLTSDSKAEAPVSSVALVPAASVTLAGHGGKPCRATALRGTRALVPPGSITGSLLVRVTSVCGSGVTNASAPSRTVVARRTVPAGPFPLAPR